MIGRLIHRAKVIRRLRFDILSATTKIDIWLCQNTYLSRLPCNWIGRGGNQHIIGTYLGAAAADIYTVPELRCIECA